MSTTISNGGAPTGLEAANQALLGCWLSSSGLGTRSVKLLLHVSIPRPAPP